eukprot:6217561-Amphidinium_carterae.1
MPGGEPVDDPTVTVVLTGPGIEDPLDMGAANINAVVCLPNLPSQFSERKSTQWHRTRRTFPKIENPNMIPFTLAGGDPALGRGRLDSRGDIQCLAQWHGVARKSWSASYVCLD